MTMEVIDKALALVRDELVKATLAFGKFNSPHEGYGIIAEEFDELFDEIKANNRERAVSEAVQVAAMATRFIIDCGQHPVHERRAEIS